MKNGLKIIPAFFKENLLFAGIIFIYFGFGLLNLDRLPIAWNDEIQNMDPAIVWHLSGEFASPLWPNPGAEKHFLSYPPLIGAWHCFWLTLSQSMWGIRLPFLVFHLISAILMFHFIKTCMSVAFDKNVNPQYNSSNPESANNNILINSRISMASACIVGLFLFDKSTFEISRSMRIEVIIIALLSILVIQLFHPPKNPRKEIQYNALHGLLLGTLLLAHLYVWPVVISLAIIRIFQLYQQNHYNAKTHFTILNTFSFLVFLALPPLLFLFLVQPEWSNLIHQLFMQVRDHSSVGSDSIKQSFLYSISQSVGSHFFYRFVPYYMSQPHVIIIHCAAWLFSISFCIKSIRKKILSFHAILGLIFLSLSIPMMLILAPHHRYFPVQYFIALLVCVMGAESIWFKSPPQNKKIILPLFKVALTLILLLPFFSKHLGALLQRNERNPELVFEFLSNNINNKQHQHFYILGEPIADYWRINQHLIGANYGFEYYPQHFQFNNDKPWFFLSRVSPKQLPFLKPINQLKIKGPFANSTWGKSSYGQKTLNSSHTYDGLTLYQIPSKNAWQKLISPATLKITSGH